MNTCDYYNYVKTSHFSSADQLEFQTVGLFSKKRSSTVVLTHLVVADSNLSYTVYLFTLRNLILLAGKLTWAEEHK